MVFGSFKVTILCVIALAWWNLMRYNFGSSSLKPVQLLSPIQRSSLHQIWEELGTYNSTYNTPPARFVAYYLMRKVSTDGVYDVEIATHISASKDKLDNLKTGLENWGGPASVAVYISSSEEIDELETFLTAHKHSYLAKTNIHVVLERSLGKQKLNYPHNILRNLAMENVVGDFFLALDADLIPSRNTYQLFRSMLSPEGNAKVSEDNMVTGTNVLDMLKNRHLFVLPAFEVYSRNLYHYSFKKMVPKDKNDLLSMIQGIHSFAKAEPFHSRDCPESQGSTNFTRWLSDASSANNGSDVGGSNNSSRGHYPIQFDDGFEPYVLAYKPGIPRYWETFRGFFYNKVSWFEELDRAGYKFDVFSDCYVVHLNHPAAESRKYHTYVENKKKHEEFLEYLDRRYPKSKHQQIVDSTHA